MHRIDDKLDAPLNAGSRWFFFFRPAQSQKTLQLVMGILLTIIPIGTRRGRMRHVVSRLQMNPLRYTSATCSYCFHVSYIYASEFLFSRFWQDVF